MPTPSSLPLSMSSLSLGASNALNVDARGIDGLRLTASRDPKSAVKEAARQFEGLFMQELMKGMRKSVASTGMLDNAGSQLATDMLDTQFATRMTGLPGGLGDVIARQLERQMNGRADVRPVAASSAPVNAALAPAAAAGAPAGNAGLAQVGGPVATRQAEFVRRHSAAAEAVSAQTGIPANFMVAQAAHESGWGRREIKNADGSTSFNVFGIKAGGNWNGPVATVTTTEYVDGTPHKVAAKFRAYGSYEEAFRDYAKLMTESSRYAGAVAQVASGNTSAAGFAAGLQRAGYATDPAYAEKLTRMMNTMLRLQRAMT